jgi:DNA gyrase/topoisomerase IV subunit B
LNIEYGANDIQTLSPGRAYRERLGMYLSADLQEAMDLGLRELVYNAQDEYAATNQKDAQIKITIDTKTNEICAEDNMRGIPCTIRDDGMNALTAAFLIPHSGAKYDDKTAYSSSVGCNGQGNKIVCHTAKWLKVEVQRDGNIYFQSFHETDEGAVPDEDVKVIGKSNKTGTKITYIPSEKVYGKDTRIDIEVLYKTLRQLSYFSRGLKIILNVDGQEQVFISKNGLIDGLDTTNALSKPFQHFYKTDDCEVELALQWVKKRGQIKGYANGLYMIDGGAFISQFKSSLTRTFNSLAGKKFDGETIRGALDGFVSVKVRVGQFSNQAKTALANKEAASATSAAITEALKQFVNTRNNDFNTVVSLLERITRAEEQADKIRDAILNHEKEMTAASKKKFIDSDKLREARKLGQDSMLVVVEGDSAGGSISTGRQKAVDGDHIGILMLRGKAINALSNPIEKVLENEEVKLLLQALGLVYGQKYNSKKLRYGKIAIASDADFDGAHVGLLVMSILQKLCPDFIQEGRLYWLKAPICKLDFKGKVWYYYNERELSERTQKSGDIVFYKGLGQMSPQDLKESLFNPTNQHLEQLIPSDEGVEVLLALMGDEVAPRKDFVQQIDFGGFEL